MPLYSITHIIPLSEGQKDRIAEEVTRIHSDIFSTPKLFVNVEFKDIANMPAYVAGKKRKTNRIIAYVRSGGNRSNAMWDQTCEAINKMWIDVVGNSGDQELRAIFITGGLIAGSEAGFSIPGPGEDQKWIKEHLAAFKKKAQDGDTDFAEMLEELRTRDAFKGIWDGQTNGTH